MPYTKLIHEPYEETKRLLRGYGINATKLCDVLRCSYSTARGRLIDPGTITTREWELINRVGHVPIEKIREAFLG